MSFPKRYTGPGWANLAPSSETCKGVCVGGGGWEALDIIYAFSSLLLRLEGKHWYPNKHTTNTGSDKLMNTQCTQS